MGAATATLTAIETAAARLGICEERLWGACCNRLRARVVLMDCSLLGACRVSTGVSRSCSVLCDFGACRGRSRSRALFRGFHRAWTSES